MPSQPGMPGSLAAPPGNRQPNQPQLDQSQQANLATILAAAFSGGQLNPNFATQLNALTPLVGALATQLNNQVIYFFTLQLRKNEAIML